MSRGKLKFDWNVYSARRKVTLKSLLEKGQAKDYESYVSYCDEMSVVPITREKYDAEVALLVPSVHDEIVPLTEGQSNDLAKTSHQMPEEQASSAELVATVWLGGVVDTSPPDATPPPSKKKKKPKETASDTKE